MNKKAVNLKNMIAASMFGALIFVVTAYMPRIPLVGGYVHFGDVFVYLAACTLPFPYAVFSAAFGAALADSLTGYLIYAPATFIIKALMAMMFRCRGEKYMTWKNLLTSCVAGLVGSAGYYLYEVILYRSLVSPAVNLPYNLLQAAASILLFVVFAWPLDQTHCKRLLQK